MNALIDSGDLSVAEQHKTLTGDIGKVTKANQSVFDLQTKIKNATLELNEATAANDTKKVAALRTQIVNDATKLKTAQDNLAKLVTPQTQDATPKAEPSKQFAPIKANAEAAITALDQQIENLRTQDEDTNADEIENLTDKRYAIQATLDEPADIDAQFVPLKQAKRDAKGNAKAYNTAKNKVDKLSERYKRKKNELDKFLTPPKQQEKPVPENYTAPEGSEVANELAAIRQRKSELEAQGQRQNATEINNLNKRRDRIQDGYNEIAKKEAEAQAKENELATITDEKAKQERQDQLTSLYAQIEGMKKNLSNFINPPQKKEKTAPKTYPVPPETQTLDEQIAAAKDSAEEENLKRKKREVETQNDKVAKLKSEKAALEKSLSRKTKGSKGYGRAQQAIDAKDKALANAEKRLKNLVTPKEETKPKEQKPKDYAPATKEAKIAITYLKSRIKALGKKIGNVFGKDKGSDLATLSAERAQAISLLNKIQAQNNVYAALLAKAREFFDAGKTDEVENMNSELTAERQKLTDLIPKELPEKKSKENRPKKEKAAKAKSDKKSTEMQPKTPPATVTTQQTTVQPTVQPQTQTPPEIVPKVGTQTTQQVENLSQPTTPAQKTQPQQSESQPAAQPKKQPSPETKRQEPPPTKTQPKAETKPAETKPEQREENEPTNRNGRIFESIEVAEKRMLESLKELGIEPLEKEDTRRPKLVDFVDDSDEALERAIAKWNKAANKLSANAIFDPDLWTAGLEIGAIYVQRGINKFADWATKMTKTLGKESEPWQSAIWETIRTLPERSKFNEKVITNIAEYIGKLTRCEG